MSNNFSINPENPESAEATSLLTELSLKLAEIAGNDGKSSFDISDMFEPRSLFVIAKNKNKEAVGCGAIRPVSTEIAEVKRMYSKGKGAGKAILEFLEIRAAELGYKELRLETRRVNEYAVNFYLKNGFRQIPNYGKYDGRPEAVCFSKIL